MTDLKKVLVTAPYFLPVVDRYRERFADRGYHLHVLAVRERAEEQDLLPEMPDTVGVICGDDRFTPRVLEQAPKLRCIAKWGTGIDSIDQEACARLGIAIRRTLDAFSHPVADSVLGYALNFCRNLTAMDRAMKGGTWQKIDGFALREATFGIVGVGNCGRQVGHRVAAFGARLLGNDLEPIAADYLERTGMESCTLEQVLRESDIVSVNTDLNPTSHHLINAETLAWMKPTAYLINAARGPIVHEVALCEALAAGTLGGAALDVFEDEPVSPDSPLLEMDQVFLAPHNANSSPEAWNNVHESTVSQLLEELAKHE